MKETALVVMAAGIGSRFGGGIKQLEPVGPSGEIIMDYAIYDAIEAGFNKVVFIIRRDLEKDFKEIIGNRIEKLLPVAYAYQEMDDLPAGFTVPEGRKKPWGTGQAVLAAKKVLDCPFVVINADDYYGKEALVKVHEFLVSDAPASDKMQFCMAGFILGNTLSDNGAVTRGICEVSEDGYLTDVVETGGIERNADGDVICERDGGIIKVSDKCHVSMNMWGFTTEILDVLEEGFVEFLKEMKPEEGMKKEYLLPGVVGDLLKDGRASVAVLETNDKWFGVTYKEDKQSVVDSFRKLTDAGVYPEKLFA